MQKRLSHEVIRVVATLAFLVLPLCAQTSDYDQPYRPQVHFSPEEHWTNDPNGLVFYQGEYHLFFQYNPFGNQWGHMSWGHAVSTDLLHWHELPVAIPEHDDTMIFTGSVVVDHQNTSGLCTHGDCLVAIYTGHTQTPEGIRQTQNLAVSLDKGRNWAQYPGNPVLDLHMADFRDPSVTWDPTAHHWIMAVSLPKEHKVRFYSSPDLKQWTQLSDFGPTGDTNGDWECPDLIRVPSSNSARTIWALKVGLNPGAPQGGSGEQYFLGDFDGKAFHQSRLRGSHGWTNYGKDDYCAISFNSLPKDQKPTLLGWMSNWQYAAKIPTTPWRGQMSLPRRLSYISDSAGLALIQEPVVAPLRGKNYEVSALSINSSALYGSGHTIQPPFEIRLQFGHPVEPVFGLRIYSDQQHWTEVAFDTNKKEFYIDRTHSGAAISPDFPVRTTSPLITTRPYDLTLIVDRSSVEAFAQDGTIAMTDLVFPVSNNLQIQIFPDDAKPIQSEGQLWELKSIW
ncbi:glycoside hydrolase family 32 protein [Tunturiibacter gelidoferens]|uniref:Glycoside hydrolase family 32 protein n=1 Tax=Tunturiibacter gelidiferens TaxID=3069689 RepID=A0AAU7Z6J1_9BACT